MQNLTRAVIHAATERKPQILQRSRGVGNCPMRPLFDAPTTAAPCTSARLRPKTPQKSPQSRKHACKAVFPHLNRPMPLLALLWRAQADFTLCCAPCACAVLFPLCRGILARSPGRSNLCPQHVSDLLNSRPSPRLFHPLRAPPLGDASPLWSLPFGKARAAFPP